MSGPQTVEVVVRGTLGPELIAALHGFRVRSTADGVTKVTGEIPDQARLIGLLDMLDELHIEVISVNFAADGDGD